MDFNLSSKARQAIAETADHFGHLILGGSWGHVGSFFAHFSVFGAFFSIFSSDFVRSCVLKRFFGIFGQFSVDFEVILGPFFHDFSHFLLKSRFGKNIEKPLVFTVFCKGRALKN